MNTLRACWCGTAELLPFSREYSKCASCGTLIYSTDLAPDKLLVQNDETDFYGKTYWLEHQANAFGYANIYVRARNDLTERNLHWLKTLLKYRLPPASVLELGCAHGSLVALLKQTGYEAVGVEMSPWVVAFASKTFGISIYTGPVESLDLPHSSLDVIVLMDVLEHLPDPLATMRRCLELLRPDGLLLIQTPKFTEGLSYQSLIDNKDRFLEMLIPKEHIYLFSERSITEFFRRLGANHIQFEPAIFAHYDMFLAVSRVPLEPLSSEEIEAALLATPRGRLSLALLDMRQRELDLTAKLAEAEADRSARGEQITTLTEMLKVSEGALVTKEKRLRRMKYLGRVAGALLDLIRVARPNGQSKRQAHNALGTIAVDLTPVLPGGDNGGAKIFVVELLQLLAELAPETRFILLTQAASHDELASLDRPNMRRLLTVGAAANSLRPRLRTISSMILPYLPGRIKGKVGRLGYRLNMILKRGGSSSLLRKLEADLLFCPFTAPTYAEAGIPVVCTIYDFQYKAYPEFFAEDDVTHRERTFVEASRRASILAAISDFSRQSIIAHGKVDASRVRTIHLRMAQRSLADSKADVDVLTRLGVQPQRYLMYPANFWKHKNHEMLLVAFGIACNEGLAADVKLICTGAPGARQQWLMRAAQTMQLGDRVVFPGYLPAADLAIVLDRASAVIFPSLYEGFGLPVVEAMAAGVPVACSNITSLPEVAADAALLFDPRVPTQIAGAMISLVHDEEQRHCLIERGLQRAAEFSDARRMAKEYWDIFQYAMAVERNEDLLTGVYSDRWAGSALNVQVAPTQSTQTLQIRFFAPSWLPYPKVVIQLNGGGKARGAPFEIVRGTNALWSMKVDAGGGNFDIRIFPTFVPNQTGLGEDHRELSVILQRCSILRGGEDIALLSEEAAYER